MPTPEPKTQAPNIHYLSLEALSWGFYAVPYKKDRNSSTLRNNYYGTESKIQAFSTSASINNSWREFLLPLNTYIPSQERGMAKPRPFSSNFFSPASKAHHGEAILSLWDFPAWIFNPPSRDNILSNQLDS